MCFKCRTLFQSEKLLHKKKTEFQLILSVTIFTYLVATYITVCQTKSKHNKQTLHLKCMCQELFTFSGAVDGPIMSSFGHLQHPCTQEVFIGAVCWCVTPHPLDQKQEQTESRDTQHIHTPNFTPPKEQGSAGRLLFSPFN